MAAQVQLLVYEADTLHRQRETMCKWSTTCETINCHRSQKGLQSASLRQTDILSPILHSEIHRLGSSPTQHPSKFSGVKIQPLRVAACVARHINILDTTPNSQDLKSFKSQNAYFHCRVYFASKNKD